LAELLTQEIIIYEIEYPDEGIFIDLLARISTLSPVLRKLIKYREKVNLM
jgi:hypothetical protein